MSIPNAKIGLEYELFREQLALKIRTGEVMLSDSNRNYCCYFCSGRINTRPVKIIVFEERTESGGVSDVGLGIHEHCYNQARLGDWDTQIDEENR